MNKYQLLYLVACMLFVLDAKPQDNYGEMEYYNPEKFFYASYTIKDNLGKYGEIINLDLEVSDDFDTEFPDTKLLGIKIYSTKDKQSFKLLRNFLSVKKEELTRMEIHKKSIEDFIGTLNKANKHNVKEKQQAIGILDRIKKIITKIESLKKDWKQQLAIKNEINGYIDYYYLQDISGGESNTELVTALKVYQDIIDANIAKIDTSQYTTKENKVSIIKKKTEINSLLGRIKDDISKTSFAIDEALAPEYKIQTFRQWVSAIFAVLIAIIIISFFKAIGQKNKLNTSTVLLSNNGLQFITIFVLIIAVVLFGILNILEARELSAILSSIAGYILGRTNIPLKKEDTTKVTDEVKDNKKPAAPEPTPNPKPNPNINTE